MAGFELEESVLTVDPIIVHGNQETAERIFHECFDQEKLKENMPENLLYCLGYLEYEPALPILMKYMKENHWYLSTEACLGLVHLSCKGYEDVILQEIQSCMGKPLFNEFIPVLSFKIDELYQWGSMKASTDCNAGILLGIALYGEKTRGLYKKILWDEHWEADSPSTGTRYWTYIGMQYLQISFRELYEEIKENIQRSCESNALEYQLNVLHALLECKISDHHMPIKFGCLVPESYADIYQILFECSGPHKDDSIIDLIRENVKDNDYKEWLRSDFHKVKEMLEIKIKQELTEMYVET